MNDTEGSQINKSSEEQEKKLRNKFLMSGILPAAIFIMLGLCCGPLIPLGPEGMEKAEALGWVITTLWIIYLPLGTLIAGLICKRIYLRHFEKGSIPPQRLAILTGMGVGIAVTLIARLVGEFLYSNLDSLLEGFF
jgi:hypothetical protein